LPSGILTWRSAPEEWQTNAKVLEIFVVIFRPPSLARSFARRSPLVMLIVVNCVLPGYLPVTTATIADNPAA